MKTILIIVWAVFIENSFLTNLIKKNYKIIGIDDLLIVNIIINIYIRLFSGIFLKTKKTKIWILHKKFFSVHKSSQLSY